MLRVLFVAAGSVAFGPIATAQCPAQWLPSDVELGTTPGVSALAVWDPDGPGPAPPWLIAAGDFFEASGLHVNRVAAWDGSRWSPLGNGFPLSGDIEFIGALAVFNGALIAAGSTLPAGNGYGSAWAARWDGQDWVRFDPPSPSEPITRLCLHDGALIAAATDSVLAWDGQLWRRLGTGPSSYVESVLSSNGVLYCSSADDGPPGPVGPVVWRWDGAAWQPMSDGLRSPFQAWWVSDLAEFQGSLYATGYIEMDTSAYGVARWDGQSWHGAGLSAEGQFFGSWNDQLFLEVRGDPSKPGRGSSQYLFDGTHWALMNPQGPDAIVTASALFGDSLILGGIFSSCDGAVGNGVVSWNSRWSQLANGVSLGIGLPAGYTNAIVSALARQDERVIAAGYLNSVFGQCAGAVAAFDGARWNPIPGAPFGIATRLAVEGPKIAAAGVVNTDDRDGIALWDGNAWTLIARNDSVPIVALAWYQHRLIAQRLTLQQWDGALWTDVPGAPANFRATALHIDGDSIVAAGIDYTNPGNGINRVALFDGHSWRYVNDPLPLYPTDVTVFDGRITVSGGVWGPANQGPVVQPNEPPSTGWHALGQPGAPGNAVQTLLATADGLIAGGSFTQIGGVLAGGLARWDGAAWHPLGSIAGHLYQTTINAAVEYGGGLMVGGQFESIDRVISPIVARFSATPPACYANCDCSTAFPLLNAADYLCFLSRFASGDPYANCDGSEEPPTLNINDFICFQARFAAGCS